MPEHSRRSGDLTVDHLLEMATRLEASTREVAQRIEATTLREIDHIRTDVENFRVDVKENLRSVHARVSEVRDKVKEQNGRVGKCERAIDALRQLSASAGLPPTAVQRVEQGAKVATEMSKPRLAAVLTGLIVALAGVLEVAHKLGDVLLAWLTK